MTAAGAAIRAQRRISDTLLQLYLDRKRMPFRDAPTAERYDAALRRAIDAADRLTAKWDRSPSCLVGPR